MTDAEERIRNDLAAQIKQPVRAVSAIAGADRIEISDT